jgi:hypothetical protein
MTARRSIVVLGGILASMLAVPRSAAADAPAPATTGTSEASAPPATPSSRWLATLRARLAADRLSEAELLLRTKEVEDPGSADSLALMQLRFVIDAWSALGRVPAATRSARPSKDTSEGSDSWHLLLTRARETLIAGDYARAATLLLALDASAPDPRWASAARELALVAEEVGETHGATPAMSAPEASASSEASPPVRSPREPRHWYGWETLLADGISLVTAPIIVGIGGYFLATPITHVAHGNPGRAFGSIAMRIALPLTLGLVGSGSSTRDESTGLVVGGLLGVATAIILDASVLAYEPVAKEKFIVPGSSPSATLVPRLNPRPEGGFEAGLAGRF